MTSEVNKILDSIQPIEGWIYDSEAELLISTVRDACKLSLSPNIIVEIGAYQGKTTVLIGNTIKAFDLDALIYSIDPHEGIVSGMPKMQPSFDALENNIKANGLTNIVKIIKDYSYKVKWDLPISLLFIDGLHDYENVSRDCSHFSQWIMPPILKGYGGGGYVAFHDYNDTYPGVKKFVDELLGKGNYKKVNQIEGLIILQKI